MAALATGTSVRNRPRSARTVALAANSNIPDTVPPLEDLYARGVRLALFSGNYNGVKDGAAVALNRLVAFLERAGVEVLVFSPTIEHAAMEPVGTVVSVRSLPIPRRSEYRIALGLPRAARKRLAAFRPSLFHLSAPDLLGYAALRLARQWQVPAVASFHTRFDTYLKYYGLARLENPAKRYLRHFYGRCEQVYVPSSSMATVLRDEGIAANLRIWGRGVDCSLFTPAKRDLAWRESWGIKGEDVVISFAGRLVREKGLDVFAAALDRMKARGVQCRTMIIGDGPERDWLAQRLPDAIFTGFLTGDGLARAYASSDVFFFPSITETFGIVTLEAMATALPVVCADSTGSSSLVARGSTGFLAKPGDIEQFASCLAKLATDPELRAQMGSAGRVEARAHDWDGVMQSLLGHYREVLACYGRAPVFAPAPVAIGASGYASGEALTSPDPYR
jgi:glycosyltransferase involved in cell wall biosynthesis